MRKSRGKYSREGGWSVPGAEKRVDVGIKRNASSLGKNDILPDVFHGKTISAF